MAIQISSVQHQISLAVTSGRRVLRKDILIYLGRWGKLALFISFTFHLQRTSVKMYDISQRIA